MATAESPSVTHAVHLSTDRLPPGYRLRLEIDNPSAFVHLLYDGKPIMCPWMVNNLADQINRLVAIARALADFPPDPQASSLEPQV